MRKLKFFLFAALIAAIPAYAVKYVAVVETEVDAASGASSGITSAEAREITAEIRRQATENLPQDKYSVMTSETVISMGGAVLEECSEENCVITLGSKIGADYIVRATISKFQTRFTLKVEFYETDNGTLVAMSEPVRSENIGELLDKTTETSANMYKKFLNTQNATRKQQPALNAYVVTAANPPEGGTVSRNPDQEEYAPGTTVNLTAAAAAGYKFTGWSGDATGGKNRLKITVDGDKMITANFYKQPERAAPERPTPKPKAITAAPGEKPKKRTPLWAGLTIDAVGAGALIYGVVQENKVKNYVDDKKYLNRAEYEDADKAADIRNVSCVLGGALLLTGISIHIFF